MASPMLNPTSTSLLLEGYQTEYLIFAIATRILTKNLPKFKYLMIAGAALNRIGLETITPGRFPHSTDFSTHVIQTLSGVRQAIIDECINVIYERLVDRKEIETTINTVKII